MNLEKLTVRSQEVLQGAQQSAARSGPPEISPDHLLLALLNQEDGLAPVLLQRIGVDVARLRARLADLLEARPHVQGGSAPQIDDRLRIVLETAEAKAQEFHDDFVSVEHLLLALIEGRGGTADLLRQAGAPPRKGVGVPPAPRCRPAGRTQGSRTAFPAIGEDGPHPPD